MGTIQKIVVFLTTFYLCVFHLKTMWCNNNLKQFVECSSTCLLNWLFLYSTYVFIMTVVLKLFKEKYVTVSYKTELEVCTFCLHSKQNRFDIFLNQDFVFWKRLSLFSWLTFLPFFLSFFLRSPWLLNHSSLMTMTEKTKQRKKEKKEN